MYHDIRVDWMMPEYDARYDAVNFIVRKIVKHFIQSLLENVLLNLAADDVRCVLFHYNRELLSQVTTILDAHTLKPKWLK